jgi:hypothetical protein
MSTWILHQDLTTSSTLTDYGWQPLILFQASQMMTSNLSHLSLKERMNIVLKLLWQRRQGKEEEVMRSNMR